MGLKRVNPFKRRSGRQLPGQSTDKDLGLDSLQIRVIDRPTHYVINRELIQIGNIGAGRYAEIDHDGVRLLTNNTVHVNINVDGDLFLGEDTTLPGSTYFSVFANNQTYNSEAMIAGDMLIGDNSPDKANILWDKSAGQLLFRGGITTRLYIDTTGALTAGAGDVVIDDDGITLNPGTGSPEKIKVKDGDAIIAELYGTSESGVSSNLHLFGRGRGDAGVNTPEGTVEIVAITHDGTPHAGAASAAIALSTAADRIELLTGTVIARCNVTAQYGLHVNQIAGNNEFRVDGDTLNHLIFTDADVDNIGIGTSSPHTSSVMDLSANIKALYLPKLTTTERDGLTPQAGFIIYNTTTSKFQGYTGAAWADLN